MFSKKIFVLVESVFVYEENDFVNEKMFVLIESVCVFVKSVSQGNDFLISRNIIPHSTLLHIVAEKQFCQT